VEKKNLPQHEPDEFYPVRIGDILHEKYQVLANLGTVPAQQCGCAAIFYIYEHFQFEVL
jgi:hypothetical protein